MVQDLGRKEMDLNVGVLHIFMAFKESSSFNM